MAQLNSTRTEYRQYCIGCIENVQYGSETAWFGIKTYSMEITMNSMGVRLGIEYLKIFPALLWLYNQDCGLVLIAIHGRLMS